ncbi:putative Tle1 phospholipase domain-containing protein [Seiridium cardinale]
MVRRKTSRSGSYPIQDTAFTPHSDSQTTQTNDDDTKTFRLPGTLRALKDSRAAEHHPRTIVICLDGTGDQFDNDNSNIVNFVSCLKKHSPTEQVTYYQSGIGTYDKGGLKNGIGAAMDMAVGSGLGIHIKDAYKFLMQNYRDGDKICLFGFSRGAYTVRCLSGMLHKVGLLPASNVSQLNFAYNFYKDDSTEGRKLAAGFKRTFCTHVDVYFVGVWDCVASVGFIPRRLPFSKSPTNSIRHFRHAMALDEHRAKFKVCQWQQENPGLHLHPKRRDTVDFTPSGRIRRQFGMKKTPAIANTNGALANGTTNGLARPGTKESVDSQDSLERKFLAQDEAHHRKRFFQTDVLECWFMGCHADVGGGAVANECRHMLSRIPLRWMLRQCFECNTGILFDTARLAEFGLDVHTLWPIYRQPARPIAGPPPRLIEKYEQKTLAPLHRRAIFLPIGDGEDRIEDAPPMEKLNYMIPSEGDEDYFDAKEICNDMLKIARVWWVLEIWPIKLRILSKDGQGWEKRVRMNLGRHRGVRDSEPKMHWTVQHAIDEGKYQLRTKCEKGVCWAEIV